MIFFKVKPSVFLFKHQLGQVNKNFSLVEIIFIIFILFQNVFSLLSSRKYAVHKCHNTRNSYCYLLHIQATVLQNWKAVPHTKTGHSLGQGTLLTGGPCSHPNHQCLYINKRLIIISCFSRKKNLNSSCLAFWCQCSLSNLNVLTVWIKELQND